MTEKIMVFNMGLNRPDWVKWIIATKPDSMMNVKILGFGSKPDFNGSLWISSDDESNGVEVLLQGKLVFHQSNYETPINVQEIDEVSGVEIKGDTCESCFYKGGAHDWGADLEFVTKLGQHEKFSCKRLISNNDHCPAYEHVGKYRNGYLKHLIQ